MSRDSLLETATRDDVPHVDVLVIPGTAPNVTAEQHRARATAADLGLNGMARRFITVQAVTLLVTGILLVRFGFSLTGWSADGAALAGAIVCAVWLCMFLLPDRRGSRDCQIAEMLCVFGLLLSFSSIAAIAQYAFIAVGLPFADSWLARSDAALGINVMALAQWTDGHPLVSRLLTIAYMSYTPQFAITVIGLGLLRDRTHLWELAFHFHLCLFIALIGVLLWPAVCPPDYYGFMPTVDMTRLIGQIKDLHTGAMTTLRLDQLEGLVSIPSFHSTGALIVAWAWRRHTRIFPFVLALNLLVIVSTFVTGVHYFIDVAAAFMLFAISLAVYHRGPRWFVGSLPEAP